MPSDDFDWLARINEEHGPTLHRLVVLLGAEEQSGRIVRAALLALHRRGHRLVDPVERVEFLQEHVVHLARAARAPGQRLQLPEVAEARQEEILSALSQMEPKAAELIVVSHYLAVFGQALAAIMRMSSRRANQRLEEALAELRARVGDPTPGSVPGAVESLQQEVTAALRSAARTIQGSGTGTLTDELIELGAERRSLVPVRTVVVACLLAMALGLGLAALTAPSTGRQPSGPDTGTASPSDSLSLPAQVMNVPLFYAGRQDRLLYREQRDLPAGGDLVRIALENLFTLVPLDPDYESLWAVGHVNGIQLDGNSLTVDLTATAYESFTTPEQASVAINQMVYTASSISGLPELTVYFLADGQPPPELFAAEEGYRRDGITPMPPIWLTDPRNGSQVQAGEVVISGTVKPEAEVPMVTVTNIETNAVVASTTAQTSTGPNQEGWRVWTVSLSLPVGSYEVRAQAIDGTGASYVESKAIKVIE